MFMPQVYLLAFVAAASWSGCPPDGPLLPRPTNLHSSNIFKDATVNLTKTLDAAIKGTITPGFSVPNSSFSLGVVSLDSPNGLPIWSYHHRGSANTNGTGTVDGNTQYLVGSVSKLVTDLLVLRTGIDVDAPITEFLPSLKNKSSIIKWEDVSLASLADHLSGIPPNYGFSEFWFVRDVLQGLGFPGVNESEVQKCGVPGLNKACTQDVLLEDLISAQPITAPNSHPVYSQLSFTLLSYALSAKYNKTYTELLDDFIWKPFSIKNSGASPGNTSLAAIPPIDNSWGSDYGDNAPGGGLYSSLNDLSVLLHSILNRSALRTEAEVRKWLKPHSTTSSPKNLVGRPWEIYRSQNLTPKYPHTIDLYAKNGVAVGYSAQVAVIDQYGIAVVVLTAGEPSLWSTLYDAILSTVMPAVEDEARAQSQHYVGNWTGRDESGVAVNITLAMDDSPGLRLDSLTRNGSDLLGAIGEVYSLVLPQFGTLSPALRIFPADIITTEPTNVKIGNSMHSVLKEDWRINLDFTPSGANTGSQLPGQGLRRDECTSWQSVDWFYHGGKAVDRVVVLKDEDGNVVGIEVPFLKTFLEKKSLSL